MRKIIALNYDWDFVPDFKPEYLNQSTLPNSVRVMIPHTMKELPLNYFADSDYQFIGTYQRHIELTDADFSGKLLIKFEAVMNIAKVYLNGELLLIHEGGYTAFTVDISDKAVIGDNLLQVLVDATEIKDIPPFGHFVDYLAFSGIYREVSLLKLPKTYIKHLHIYTEESSLFHENEMLLSFQMALSTNDDDYSVRARLMFDGKKVQDLSFSETISDSKTYSQTISKIKRWNPEETNLYVLEVDIIKGNQLIDTLSSRFGFRTANFTTDGFFINNRPIKLIGLNRHQSYPYVGYAMPKRMQESDAEILKQFGSVVVRTSHYPQSQHFLNRCDELGLLVFEEIPGWNYIGDEHFKELSYQAVENMIDQHFNHPSIIAWGVRINESADDHDFYLRTNEIAHSLDPSRATGGVRNFKKSEFLEDLYTYNDFSHVGNNPGLENPRKVTPGYVPYLVTEHNGHIFPTKKYDAEKQRVDQAIRHLNVIDAANAHQRISGAIGWCMADYNTHSQFGSNDRICHHGVMDIFRIPKFAAYAYQAENSVEPMIFVANSLIPGDREQSKIPEVLVLTNCDYVKLYKDDEFVGEFEPDWDSYPNLKHPPVIITDFIGDLLQKQEEFNEKMAGKVSHLLLSYNLHGFQMPLKDKLLATWLLLRRTITFKRLMELHEKYIAFQKQKPIRFRFEGYIDDKLVASCVRGAANSTKFVAKADTLELEHGLTYDVLRVHLALQDDLGNELVYANESFSIDNSSGLELIGPKIQSLVGGSTAIYFRTTGKIGKAEVIIIANNYPEIKLNLEIKSGILG